MTPEEQMQYERALKRVKKIKGFYTHLLVYVVINLMIVIINIQNLKTGESYFKFCAYHGLFCVLSILIILNNVMTQIVILIGVLEIRTKD